MDDRYAAQRRFAPLGRDGQERLRAATVVIVGCGALGAAAAEQLARAGVGRLRIIDRDIVEWTNLQRQCLFDESDASAGRPKAIAAMRRLNAITQDVVIEPVVGELTARNAESLLAGASVVCDGADNFPTRHRVNEACRRLRIPWVMAACVGSYAISAPFPIDGPCLRCIQDALPAPGESPTCDTQGIIAPAVHLASAWQVAETLKILSGCPPRRELWAMDLWLNSFQRLSLATARDAQCRACSAQADWPALSEHEEPAVVLCGRDVVQLRTTAIALDRLAVACGSSVNDGIVRWRDGDITLTAFADGRILVHGVDTAQRARAIVDRWLG